VVSTSERTYDGIIVTITVGGEDIESTAGHPFWVVRGRDLESRPETPETPVYEVDTAQPGRWVGSGDLQVGDELLLHTGETMPVERLAVTKRSLAVYNLRVEALHNYAVGCNEVLVHNNNPLGSGPNAKAPSTRGTQDHHGIPWNNGTWKHQDHPLVRQAGNPNLKNMKENLRALEGHAGRHSASYHQEIRRRMDEAYKRVAGKGQKEAEDELKKVIEGIWKDIESGKLKPYDGKDVIVRP
jgi:Protein of unknown function (DUF1557).